MVEHNGIAQTTPTCDTIAGSIEARGAAFGLRTWRYSDDDPDFFVQTEAAVEHVRTTGAPGFLVIDTMRLGPHSKGDDLRSETEMDAVRKRDPLTRLGDSLPAELRAEIDVRTADFVAGS